jgi:hypothetical protein
MGPTISRWIVNANFKSKEEFRSWESSTPIAPPTGQRRPHL